MLETVNHALAEDFVQRLLRVEGGRKRKERGMGRREGWKEEWEGRNGKEGKGKNGMGGGMGREQ